MINNNGLEVNREEKKVSTLKKKIIMYVFIYLIIHSFVHSFVHWFIHVFVI